MTHDELLDEIDSNLSGCEDSCASCDISNAPWIALRAVVELHKPLDNLIGEFCSHCTEMSGKDIYTLYPCFTIQAIEKELQ